MTNFQSTLAGGGKVREHQTLGPPRTGNGGRWFQLGSKGRCDTWLEGGPVVRQGSAIVVSPATSAIYSHKGQVQIMALDLPHLIH